MGEYAIAAGVAAVLLLITQLFLFGSLYLALEWESVRYSEAVAGMALLWAFAVFASIFFLPPIFAALIYESRNPKADYFRIYAASAVSSLTSLILSLALAQMLSTKGITDLLELPNFQVCLVFVPFAAGVVGVAVIILKRTA